MAASGTVVVSKTAWPAVSDQYIGEETPLGNYRAVAVRAGCKLLHRAEVAAAAPQYNMWPS